jgi:FlaG/FlaF family flagellin (archaellin)
VAVAVVAVAAVVAVVAAVVAVAAVAAVAGSPFYWEIRAAVREAVLKHLRESTSETTEKLRAIQRDSWESGAKCLERMLDSKEESAAA